MGLKTGFLNIFRRFSQIPVIERVLSESIKNGSNISKKLIADISIYPKKSFRTCTRNDIQYKLDISDYMDHAIYFNITDGVDFDRRLLYSLIKHDFICFDIGANIGETTLNFAKLAPQGRIYSFEPVPFLFERLKTNVGLNTFKNIDLHHLALSDRKEELYFEKPSNNNSSGITMSKESSSTSTLVHSTTIDLFVSDNNINRIDFIKIDVEGFENYVINGGGNTLRKFEPILFIEIDNLHLKQQDASEKILLTQLQTKFGYTLYRIDGIRKIKITAIEDNDEHYDVLCVKE